MNKKLIFIFGGILILVLFVVSIYSYFRRDANQQANSTNSNQPRRGIVNPTEYITFTIGNDKIRMKDFNQNPVRTVPGAGVYLAETDEFGIFYNTSLNQFQISILQQPIEQTRTKAEQTFLQILDISNEDACKLPVNLTGPVSVDDRFGNQPNFGLSFCPGSRTF